MNYYNKKKKAVSNIDQSKGFECPVCSSYILPGYDYCPVCGAMPQYDDETSDTELAYGWLLFLASLFAPASYYIASLNISVFSIIIFIPGLISAIVGFYAAMGRLKNKKHSFFKRITRLILPGWIIFFSVRALLLILS